MKQSIKKSDIRNLVKKIIKESAGIPSEEEYYINIMVPRIKSWMDEVYQDWGGIDAVSPQALMDFSNRNDYEETLDTFAHEFNINKEQLKPMLNKALEIAHNELKEDLLGEGREVDRFTPYTPEEKARNFEYLRTGFGRSPEERNPSYAKALKAAEERRKQKQMQQKNESIDETMNYGAERVAADNKYADEFYNRHVKSKTELCDKCMETGQISQIGRCYKALLNAYSMEEVQQDARLLKVKQEIKNKLEEIISFVQNKMANSQNESKRHITESELKQAISEVLMEWKKSINEDGYSYNGIEQQAQYRKMGEDLMAQQDKEKNYKKNVVLFKRAFNKVYKEFTIIGTLKKKSEEAKRIFNFLPFFEFVKETEGDTLYNPIWEKYGGEYLEMANTYLESNIVKLRRELGV